MSKYLIHGCEERLWYIERYLVPSMLEQGIDPHDISIYIDTEHDGNLFACIKSFNALPIKGDTWHLQDDIIISPDFRAVTERYSKAMVCGMCMNIADEVVKPKGKVNIKYMWHSFQCTLIPNIMAHEFVQWFINTASKDPQYRMWISKNKYDDSFFKVFMEDYHPNYMALNLYPNIVDHVDFLLGGSLINADFPGERRAKYFENTYLVDELARKLEPHMLTKKMKDMIDKIRKSQTNHANVDLHLSKKISKKNPPMNYN